MDSLTQAVLGAAVSVAVLGRRIGPRKAALAGAALGTLPDLDVFYPFGDPVSDFVLHRSATHSLIVQALATPLIGEAMRAAFDGLKRQRWLAYAAVFLCLATHALLDAFTVYGTQLLWPISDYPFGVGSVFIIDPLYTLPLLGVTIWALAARQWHTGLGRGIAGALVLSTAYLGWTAAAQALAERRAGTALARAGIAPERVLATPTPFNSLFWRIIAIDGERYVNVYVPLAGGDEAVRLHLHRRIEACVDAIPDARRVAEFSKGFYRVTRDGSAVRIADLRMGIHPNYVFDFRIAESGPAGLAATAPERILGPRQAEGDWPWLLAGILGEPEVRPVEAASLVGAGGRLAAGEQTSAQAC